jgi:arginine:ornithine antiporter/lysine permease
MATIFIALGIPVYIWARQEKGLEKGPIFTEAERALAVGIIAVAMVALYAFVRGLIQI